MIPERSCQDGCWAEPRGKKKVKPREQEAEKGENTPYYLQ